MKFTNQSNKHIIVSKFIQIITQKEREVYVSSKNLHQSVCLCWGFTAQSTQWGHVERGQFT